MKSQQKPQPQNWNNIFPSDSLNFEDKIRADVLKMVYEKAYKLDWSEDAFVIWLEAEIKEIK